MNNFVKQISWSWIWRALSTFLRCFGMKVQFCLRNDYDRFYQNLRNTENIYLRANLKLFNRVYIFPRKQSFQLLTKKKNVSADHQQQICSFKLPVWQTGSYYCRIPDDPTLSLNTYTQPVDGSHIEWSLTFPQHNIIELSTLLVPKFVGL